MCGCNDNNSLSVNPCPEGGCLQENDSRCVFYNGIPLLCESQFHPETKHYIVQNSNVENRRLTTILSNINDQLCYLRSKEYIKQLLTISKNQIDVNNVFCEAVCACNCNPVENPCNIRCFTNSELTISRDGEDIVVNVNPYSVDGSMRAIVYWFEFTQADGHFIQKGNDNRILTGAYNFNLSNLENPNNKIVIGARLSEVDDTSCSVGMTWNPDDIDYSDLDSYCNYRELEAIESSTWTPSFELSGGLVLSKNIQNPTKLQVDYVIRAYPYSITTFDPNDYLRLEYSTNNGTNWTTLEDIYNMDSRYVTTQPGAKQIILVYGTPLNPQSGTGYTIRATLYNATGNSNVVDTKGPLVM